MTVTVQIGQSRSCEFSLIQVKPLGFQLGPFLIGISQRILGTFKQLQPPELIAKDQHKSGIGRPNLRNAEPVDSEKVVCLNLAG